MNREEWLEQRKNSIGGSDVAAILGLSPFKTALDVYTEKVEKTTSNQQKTETKAMQSGRILEPAVLQYYAETMKVELETEVNLIKDQEHPFLHASIDAKVKNKNIIVEAKTVRRPSSEWSNGIPDYYKVQIAHYAHITNADSVHVCALFGFLDFAIFEYNRDFDFENQIRNKCVEFWNNHILTQNPPEATSVAAYKQDNTSFVAQVAANDNIENVIEKVKLLEFHQKETEQEIKALKAELFKALGDNKAIVVNGEIKVKLDEINRKIFDLKTFKEAHIDLYNKYLRTTSSLNLKII